MSSRAIIHTLAALVTGCLLPHLSFAAGPEHPVEPPVPAITITAQGLSSNGALTGSGHAFVLESSVDAALVVEFALVEGQRVACAPRGRTPRLGQTFALSSGESLICHARPGRYGFSASEVMRLVSGGMRPGRFTGWIEIS